MWRDRLVLALLASILMHAMAIAIPWMPNISGIHAMQAPPLEVVLLNAQRSARMDPKFKAQALAQSQNTGGGDGPTRAKTTRPQQAQANPPGHVVAMEQGLQELERHQKALLQHIQAKGASAPVETQRALAEIEKRIQEEHARPRKRYLGPSTQEVSYAEYYDRLRHQIEALGTRQFPIHQGKKLYGELTLVLTVDALGHMVSVDVLQSSGQTELDRRARAIANAAAPFGAFTPKMKKEADQLAWVIRFRFDAANGLNTQWHEPDSRLRP